MLRRLRQPWDPSQPSILEHVQAHLPGDDEPGLLPGGHTLPDEEPGQGLRFAPGMFDGVNTRHFGGGDSDREIEAMLAAVRACGHRRSGLARLRLYELAMSGKVIEVIDRLLDAIRTMGVPPEAIRPAARWLANEGRHREPVKLGVALPGLCAEPKDREILRILGRHEEFTLYAGIALAAHTPEPDRELYALAQTVQGWGRIELVERLSETADAEIREWVYRHGFRNSIMYEYLAHTAATTGDLVGHLRNGPDQEALDAACDIIAALIEGFPGQDIDAYDEAPTAVMLLLEVLRERASQLSHFLVVDDIMGFLGQDGGWVERLLGGWTEQVRQRAKNLAEEIQAKPIWTELAACGLDSDDSRQRGGTNDR